MAKFLESLLAAGRKLTDEPTNAPKPAVEPAPPDTAVDTAAPVAVALPDTAATAVSDSLAGGELEEWSEPLPEAALPPLPLDSVLQLPSGRAVRLARATGVGAEANEYAAEAPGEDGPVRVRLREAVGGAQARLENETALRAANTSSAVPTVLESGVVDGRYYVLDAGGDNDSTLADMLEGDVSFGAALKVLVQIAATVARVHAAGWLHLSLRPEAIAVDETVRIIDFGQVCPIAGTTARTPLSFPGYSAPELAQGEAVDVRTDVYALGAILFHIVSGHPVPETGVDMALWSPRHIVAGVPQILHRCLGAPATRYASCAELHGALQRLGERLQPVAAYAVAANSTIGLAASREANQDAYATLGGTLHTDDGALPWACVCVADGMGGMAAGEVASAVAVRAMQSAAATHLATAGALTAADQATAVREWAAAANAAVCAELSARQARGGCTLVCALVIDRRLTIAHVGDCRVYLLRGDACTPLTRDHSFVMSLLLQGEITEAEIRSHPSRNQVTRSLGDRHPQPDYYIDSLEPATGAASLDLQAGDVLLLCSDGLWEPVLESEMLGTVRRLSPDLQAATAALQTLTLQRGAPDNSTVVLLRLDETTVPIPSTAPGVGMDGNAPEDKSC